MARDHTHRNGGGNIVIGKPDTENKPNAGDIVRVGGHTGRVVDGAPWGDVRGVNSPADPGTGFQASQDDVAIQVIEAGNRGREPRLSLYQVDAVSGNRPRTFYVVARSPGEAIGDVVQGINEIGSRRRNPTGLDTRSLVATELPNHFPLEVFRDCLKPISFGSPLFS